MDEEADKQQQERASFEEHAKKLKHVHFEKTIKLNVGGVLYKTSLTTLVKDPNSMLAVMFSGRFELQVDEDGSYFIDRDGELFRYILNYLRNGELLCSKVTLTSVKEQLLAEAQFYQLEDLIHQLSPVPKVFSESSIITCCDQEDTLLSLITEHPADTKWNLLYKATRDGWHPNTFHKKCDEKSPTLLVIKSGDNIFGGYADKSWSSPDQKTWVPCPDSFLFSLTNPGRFSPQKMYPKPAASIKLVGGGITCDSNSGPLFGTKDYYDIETMTYYANRRLGKTDLGQGFLTQYDAQYFVGSNLFLMHELEVFGLSQ